MKLIDADALHEQLEEIRQEMLEENTLNSDFSAAVIETVQDEYLRNMPPVDAAPVVHGRWLPTNDDNKKKCSQCDVIHLIAQYPHGQANYCPNCGAKMDGGNEDG